MLAFGVASVVSGCGSGTRDVSDATQTGGSMGSGGSVSATGASGGSAAGSGATDPTGGGAAGGGGANGGSAAGGAATGASGTGGAATGGTSTGGMTTVQPEAFELQGTWLYLGPWDGGHTLEISNASMVYADIAGEWSSRWTLQDHNNELDRFQLVFESGAGTYSPKGQNLSGTYVLSGAILTVQLADGLGSYAPVQSPGSCTGEGSTRIVDCGLYMRQE